MPTEHHTIWIVATTGDQLATDDAVPIARIRTRMRLDAERWSRQGLTFPGVEVNPSPGVGPKDIGAEYYGDFVVTGDGYQLRTLACEGKWVVDALKRAAIDDWTEFADGGGSAKGMA